MRDGFHAGGPDFAVNELILKGHDASFDCIYIGRECPGKAVAINPKKAVFVGRKNGGSDRSRRRSLFASLLNLQRHTGCVVQRAGHSEELK